MFLCYKYFQISFKTSPKPLSNLKSLFTAKPLHEVSSSLTQFLWHEKNHVGQKSCYKVLYKKPWYDKKI